MTGESIIKSKGRELPDPVFNRRGTILLESIKRDHVNRSSWLFKDPVEVIQCNTSSMVPYCIDQIEDATARGRIAAGFISYEAGYAWTPGSPPIVSPGFPLVWFGLYDKAERFEGPLPLPPSHHPQEPINHGLDMSANEYRDSVNRILHHIREGETYQVNLTARTRFRWRYGAWQLYLRLRRSQPVPYGAYLNCGEFSLVSLSPELFLMRSGDSLHSRPMKGTAPRGSDMETDKTSARWLRSDAKNRAENLMIVDLVRNDLGKLAQKGEVRVFDPYRIERYSGLFQMTSGVECTMREDVGLLEILESTFPPGSVTGAPKVSTMKIISGLEKASRRAYTGAIGYIEPEGGLSMSVAIRTVISRPSGLCEMGVGSGIVHDSVPEDESRETFLKAEFLNFTSTDRMDLFETILLRKDGSLLWLKEHLERMERSARQLGYPFNEEEVQAALQDYLDNAVRGPAIIRMVLARTGDLNVQVLPKTDMDVAPRRAVLSATRMDPCNGLLRHKTTRRAIYDVELKEARKLGFREILYLNSEGHLTEGSFTNLFLLTESGWATPPVECGLLPGIWRKKFLQWSKAIQFPLTIADILNAKCVVVGNSVRGAVFIDEVVDQEGDVIFSGQTSPDVTGASHNSGRVQDRLL